MSSWNKPQKLKDYDYFTREARTLPKESVGNENLWKILKNLEIGYRKGRLTRPKMVKIGCYIRNKYNIDYRILSKKHVVFLPRNNEFVYKYMFEEKPQLIAIMGNRGTGKTITAWRLLLKFFEHQPNAHAYIYGDVDNMTPSFQYTYSQFKDQVHYKHTYKMPPKDGKTKLILYNELSKEMMGKRAMSEPNIEMNLQALRSRHSDETGKTWVIYNVIRYSTLEGVLRDTADIQLFGWMGAKLMENMVNLLPTAWDEIVKYSENMVPNESLVFIPIQGKGTYMGIYETNPPKSLLKAHWNASDFQRPEYKHDKEKIDGLELATKLYRLHAQDYDSEKYKHPAVELSQGQGKKSKWIPLTYGNLSKLVKEHKQSVARRVQDIESD